MRPALLAPLAAAAATAALLAAGAASAGEVTGKGKSTAAPDHARSICAFSGLNDNPEGAPGNPPGNVQNWGHTMQMFGLDPRDFNPGDACNPHAEHE
ncbi:hypothetical protein LRS10_20255 [Phenylobacterium sp. J426]|uniref:hypothetical protein n=1 Tax=Phenylobacterium sp. J426 TaxID=2898439 RepID=UPI002150BB3F|nr:hypothetical protein [Phenylobacterium sp. J426]MCR5876275.1 hypothetical protein [Phenylobacterium sp. J426]